MRISVFGLGYVGAVTAACLAADGHEVVGVDPNGVKVELVNSGVSPVVEAGLGDLIASAVHNGHLRACSDAAEAVAASDLAFVCVGTPSRRNGDLDLTYVLRVSQEIGSALRRREDFFTLVLRSTVLPGTTRGVVIPALQEASDKQAGTDFGVCVNPEFLREGSAVRDFDAPPKVILAASDEQTAAQAAQLLARPRAPLLAVDFETAELAKYTDNAWHALKVAFANEIGAVAKAHGVDGQQLMELLCADHTLNISSAYLTPGFAFGGSCLPKDVRALTYRGRRLDLDLPLLNAVLPSNRRHLERAYELVVAQGARKVGVLGLSFKAGTDDMRESPMLELVERLHGKGYDLRVYDGHVNLATLVGANRDYLLTQMPHISELMVDSVADVLSHADTLVVGTADPEFKAALGDLDARHAVVDFVRIAESAPNCDGYEGLCW